MLRVPTLKPEQHPFDPDATYRNRPELKRADHVLTVEKPPARDGVLTDGAMPAAPEPIPERELLFDDAAVRDALTSLHERGDDYRRGIEKSPGRIAATMDKETREFLKTQRKDLAATLVNDRQRAAFQSGFDAYSRQTVAWNEAVREEKQKAYDREVGIRQRELFGNSAVRPETLFDDESQSRYRNMILMSVDNEYKDAPREERQAALDRADSEFCRRVLEKRLEGNPASTRPLLASPAVRRVVGEDEIRRYEDRVAKAVRQDELCDLGRTWAAAGLSPDNAEREASLHENEGGATALREYKRLRNTENRSLVQIARQRIETAMRDMDGPDADARQTSLRRTDPDIAATMESIRNDQRRTGLPTQPDYARLLELTDGFDADAAAESLRERKAVLQVYSGLRADPETFSTYMRMVSGEATVEDSRRLDSLRRAREAATALQGGRVNRDVMSAFLHRFSEDARIYRERHGYNELDSGEEAALIRRTAEAMGIRTAERSPHADPE